MLSKIKLTRVSKIIFSLKAPIQPKKPTKKITVPAIINKRTGSKILFVKAERLFKVFFCIYAQIPIPNKAIPVNCEKISVKKYISTNELDQLKHTHITVFTPKIMYFRTTFTSDLSFLNLIF